MSLFQHPADYMGGGTQVWVVRSHTSWGSQSGPRQSSPRVAAGLHWSAMQTNPSVQSEMFAQLGSGKSIGRQAGRVALGLGG